MNTSWHFVDPWDNNGRCTIEVGGTLYQVKRLAAAPPWPTEFRAYDPWHPPGVRKAIDRAGRFSSLIRKLAKREGVQ